MKNFSKVVRIGTTSFYRNSAANVFAKIEFKEGKLSISGVEGPKPNGDAWGGCGQIVMGYAGTDKRYPKPKTITPAPGWTPEMVARFWQVWERWHLNDMKAGCEHQRGPGWDFEKELTIYRFTLTDAARKEIKEAEEAALVALGHGKTFKPTKRQTFVYNLKSDIETASPDLPADRSSLYCPDVKKYDWQRHGETRTERAGSVRPTEHPEGLLCKPCEVCGYRYGTEWKREEVPADVLSFLRSLPDADMTPAWV
jgi:hypothetical protein